MYIVCLADDSHEMSILILSEKYSIYLYIYFKMSSAAVVKRTLRVKTPFCGKVHDRLACMFS